MIALRINGTVHRTRADREMPLLWFLRDTLGLLGTRYGCGIGVCGACTVHLDGEAVPSCLITLAAVGDRDVTTIEGLSGDGSHPVQQAWIEEDVAQCGYCQSGQIMAAAALLRHNPSPSRNQVRRAMDGNLCRCGTYVRIEGAVQRAARKISETT